RPPPLLQPTAAKSALAAQPCVPGSCLRNSKESVEQANQHQSRAMDAVADFPSGSLQDAGGLLSRQLAEVAEDESRSNVVIHALERFAKENGETAILESSVGEVAPVPVDRHPAQTVIASRRSELLGAGRGGSEAPSGQGGLDCDPAEPRSEAASEAAYRS